MGDDEGQVPAGLRGLERKVWCALSIEEGTDPHWMTVGTTAQMRRALWRLRRKGLAEYGRGVAGVSWFRIARHGPS